MASLTILIAGCDAATDRETGTIAGPAANTAPPTPLAGNAPAPAMPREGESVIQRVDPATLAVVEPVPPPTIGPIPTRKDFTDPPLPPELKHDGGLTPLPSPPSPTPDR